MHVYEIQCLNSMKNLNKLLKRSQKDSLQDLRTWKRLKISENEELAKVDDHHEINHQSWHPK